MAYTDVPGLYYEWPKDWGINTASTSSIDATGEKLAMCGRFIHPDKATKTITRVGFRFGTVVKAGGSGLTVSLQNLDQTNKLRPDETQDQTVAIANGDANFASNTWCRTNALSASRSVAFNEELAVVIEFDGSGRLGSDAVNILRNAGGINPRNSSKANEKLSGTWNNAAGTTPMVALECDDGSFGTLVGSTIYSGDHQIFSGYDSGDSPDEIGNRFTVPYNMKVIGAWAWLFDQSGDPDFDLCLYNGTTLLASESHLGAVYLPDNNNYYGQWFFDSEVELTTGNTYYVAIKATSAGNVRLVGYDVTDEAHFDCNPGGGHFRYAQRTDAGAWSVTSTRITNIGLLVSAVETGGGGRRPRARYAGV